jgi:two-component system sensor histidine kinase KdpD
MLAVGVIVAQLTSGLRFQARIASRREDRARALYELARELSVELTAEGVERIATKSLASVFRAQITLLRPNLDERLQPSLLPGAPEVDLGTAQWAFDRGEPAGATTDTLPGSEVLYLPLKTELRPRGVLAVKPSSSRMLLIPEQRRQLETFSTLIAVVLERIHFVEVAQQALVTMESERLRNSVLAALSHDLRTPLTALVGLAESMTLARPPLPPEQAELAAALADQARRMSTLVHNLLDMARIETGEMRLHREWQPFEEVVGSALASLKPALSRHRIDVAVPRGLPLVEYDATLIERVLANLVENAAKYTPEGSTIRIEAAAADGKLTVAVIDDGPGLPPGREREIFDKFTRGGHESATPGVGLGLAICRAIVAAHHGSISARSNAQRGATFTFSLPLGAPPTVPDVEAAAP